MENCPVWPFTRFKLTARMMLMPIVRMISRTYWSIGIQNQTAKLTITASRK